MILTTEVDLTELEIEDGDFTKLGDLEEFIGILKEREDFVRYSEIRIYGTRGWMDSTLLKFRGVRLETEEEQRIRIEYKQRQDALKEEQDRATYLRLKKRFDP